MLRALVAVVMSLAGGGDTLTVADVKAVYPIVFTVTEKERNGMVFTSFDADTLPSGHPLAAFVRDNYHYLLYLGSHAPVEHWSAVAATGASGAELRTRVHQALRSDSLFNAITLTTIRAYLRSRGSELRGEIPPVQRRKVTLDEIIPLAVRFFYPDAILPNGRIQAHICVGINGIRDYERGRDPALEAFIYSAIFRDVLKADSPVDREFNEVATLVNRMGLSSDSTVRLARAQGMMWGRMAGSANLRRALVEEYRAKRAYLPFEIVGIDE